MRNLLLLFIFLFSNGNFAQNLSEINVDLNLTDSLTYETEVRIYQGGGITNYSSLFRMFKDKSDKWTAEFYEHYGKVENQAELRTEKRTLRANNDMEFVFQNLIRSHILELPNLSEIKWKLVTKGNVEKVERLLRGKMKEEYELINKKILILDGQGFKVQVNDWKRANEFEYSNPESYLKHYPEIDELIYMTEIIEFIRNEFKIWEK